MAAFNFQDLSPRLDLAGLIQRVSATFKSLAVLLKGVRRDEDGRLVSGREIEVEEAGDGLVLRTPDGSKRYRVSISNAGAVTVTLL